jgi:hypothetical protein
MSDIAIVTAETRGGLVAVVAESGYKIIEGTECKFTSLTTYSGPSADFGVINTSKSGWIAFAKHQ